MRKLLLLPLSLLLFFSCTKELETNILVSTNSPLLNRNTSITQHDIEGWLQERIDDTLRPYTGEIAAKVLLNADFDKMIIDSLNGDENLIFIPLEPDYFSQHVDADSEPLQYFILFEDANGILYKENIVLYYPEDPGFTEIPFEGFRDFLNSTNTFLDQTGKMELITISDLQIADYEFEDGMLAKSSYLASEYDPISTEENGFLERCTRWWLVRIFYDLVTHEIIDYVILAEGNTCDSGCPPNSAECDEGFGGGGGNYEEELEDKDKEVTVTVKKDNDFDVLALVTLYGKVSIYDPSLNVFRKSPDVSLGTGGSIIYNNPYYAIPYNTHHVEAQSASISSFMSFDNKTVSSRVFVTVHYPNRTSNQNELFQKSFTWYASSL